VESRAGRRVFDGRSWTDYHGLMAEEALLANFLLPILDQVSMRILAETVINLFAEAMALLITS